MATDIVYVPLQTPFLARAAAAGLKTCDGLGMLLHQAAPGFARWFGPFPEVDEQLRDIVLADLEKVHTSMIVLGLTGSIGMGKSTTAKMFAEAGVPVHDADATVHALYAGKAAPLIEKAFPGTVIDGVVDRTELGKQVVGNPDPMKRLEAIVHPLVREEEIAFLGTRAPKIGLWSCSIFRFCTKPAATNVSTRMVVVTAPAESSANASWPGLA
jgi:hypothetical protein